MVDSKEKLEYFIKNKTCDNKFCSTCPLGTLCHNISSRLFKKYNDPIKIEEMNLNDALHSNNGVEEAIESHFELILSITIEKNKLLYIKACKIYAKKYGKEELMGLLL